MSSRAKTLRSPMGVTASTRDSIVGSASASLKFVTVVSESFSAARDQYGQCDVGTVSRMRRAAGVAMAVWLVLVTSCSNSSDEGPAAVASTTSVELAAVATTVSSTVVPTTVGSTTTTQVSEASSTTRWPTDWLTIDEDDDKITFEGQMHVTEGALEQQKVWVFFLDEEYKNVPRTRAVVGEARVGDDGVASFSGTFPNEIARRDEAGWEFGPFTNGTYRLLVSNFETDWFGGPTIDFRLDSVPQVEPRPITVPSMGVGELLPTSISGVSFAESGDDAYVRLVERFGEPTMDSGWYYGCLPEDPAIRNVWWQLGETFDDPTIRVEFHGVLLDESLANEDGFSSEVIGGKTFAVYEYRFSVEGGDIAAGGEPLRTPEGLQPGISIAQLRQIEPEVNFYSVGDDTPSVNTWATENYTGRISSDPTDVTAVVMSITAGTPLSGIPC